jgi:hypothetical protein
MPVSTASRSFAVVESQRWPQALQKAMKLPEGRLSAPQAGQGIAGRNTGNRVATRG